MNKNIKRLFIFSFSLISALSVKKSCSQFSYNFYPFTKEEVLYWSEFFPWIDPGNNFEETERLIEIIESYLRLGEPITVVNRYLVKDLKLSRIIKEINNLSYPTNELACYISQKIPFYFFKNISDESCAKIVSVIKNLISKHFSLKSIRIKESLLKLSFRIINMKKNSPSISLAFAISSLISLIIQNEAAFLSTQAKVHLVNFMILLIKFFDSKKGSKTDLYKRFLVKRMYYFLKGDLIFPFLDKETSEKIENIFSMKRYSLALSRPVF